ncbi:hypothetical protein D8674_002339 [Pyrus ussuriensis x Pyrus communis]|uniref:Uncharacterized protein n=1 Tax=Pyrus ussuriensis x Pyrus communis TaxID=2448454 RepID=A0A5N5FST7_9ROSA|nr:hypothetical protein D8674_002339 [Pyrus ussuriensis x Pyrus communis]
MYEVSSRSTRHTCRSPEEANAINDIDPQAEDRENQSSAFAQIQWILGTLKEEFMKKKKMENCQRKHGTSCLTGGADITSGPTHRFDPWISNLASTHHLTQN